MTCNNRPTSPDDRFLSQQEHRNITRLWQKAIHKLSASRTNLSPNYLQDDTFDPINREAGFGQQGTGGRVCQNECEEKQQPSEAIKKKLAKGKGIPKAKSPLQQFDEIVTRELTNRRMNEEARMPSFEGSKKWSCLQFSGSKMGGEFGRSKISVENKVSRGALNSVERDVKDEDPSDVKNAALMDAIEKLAQAQAFCRFDAAVKAAEAATASVPPEMAEEVAVACAKDYQSEIVDVINEKIPLSEERKPIEVIGYIGVTKLKDAS